MPTDTTPVDWPARFAAVETEEEWRLLVNEHFEQCRLCESLFLPGCDALAVVAPARLREIAAAGRAE